MIIQRRFPTLLKAWHSLIDELAYRPESIGAYVSAITVSYPDILTVRIDDALNHENMTLGMASFTKVRWGRFLRKYFRPDLGKWIDDVTKELSELNNAYQVAGYSITVNAPRQTSGRSDFHIATGGHRHGACLASLQVQVFPKPRVILFSRACQLDRAGFLDLSLIHLVAKRMSLQVGNKVSAVWVVSNASLTVVNEMFHTSRFKKPIKGHALEHNIRRFTLKDYNLSNYGPQKRMLKRMGEVKKFGEVPKSCAISELSLEF